MTHAWDETTDRLLMLAALDLESGLPPRPTLSAHAGAEAIAIAGLRAFGPGDLLQPLLELCALLLPLGADRFALAVPGRAWSLDDPIPPVVDEVDLRQRTLTVLTLDATRAGPPHAGGSLFPYELGDDGAVRFDAEVEVGWPQGPATDGFRHLVGERHRLRDHGPGRRDQVVVQFARCLLRGHHVVLAPDVADHLEALTVA